MTNTSTQGRGTASVRLEFANGRPATSDPDEINATLHPIGFGVWPLDLTSAPAAIAQLLTQATLTDDEVAAVEGQFLLGCERLLEIIAAAGRTPQVPGGGEMSTFDTTNGVTYPQLYLVEAGIDYSRFDTFHVNTTSAGPGIDEVMQALAGAGFRILQHLPGEGEFTVTVDCDDARGWIVTYDGSRPHIGSLTQARPGTKLLVQAIGPPRYEVTYVDPPAE